VPPQYAGANYMNAVKSFVNRLHAHGLYAKVTLFWTAAGSRQALDLDPILNTDHSPAALQQMAAYFGNDRMTVLAPMEEPNGISWACWKNGGSSCSVGFGAFGMQSAVNTLRQAGATNVIALPGIDYANNLTQWVPNKPTDSMNQLMASSDVYGGNTCYLPTCLTAQDSQVIAAVPLMFSEYGETYDASSCATTNVQNMIGWADSNQVGYLAWTWNTWGNCLSLINDFAGTPHGAYGTWVRTHYLGLP
jgi:endoglucanase